MEHTKTLMLLISDVSVLRLVVFRRFGSVAGDPSSERVLLVPVSDARALDRCLTVRRTRNVKKTAEHNADACETNNTNIQQQSAKALTVTKTF